LRLVRALAPSLAVVELELLDDEEDLDEPELDDEELPERLEDPELESDELKNFNN